MSMGEQKTMHKRVLVFVLALMVFGGGFVALDVLMFKVRGLDVVYRP